MKAHIYSVIGLSVGLALSLIFAVILAFKHIEYWQVLLVIAFFCACFVYGIADTDTDSN